MFIMFFLLLLNLVISFWNASIVGRYWTEKDELPAYTRFLMWCGAIMAVCGFFSVYIIVLTMIMHDLNLFQAIALGFFKSEMSTAQVDDLVNSIFNLAYLAIIFPILGTGLAIWANSVAIAIKRHDLGSIAVAGYNTFAMAHNTINAVRYVPSATKDLAKSLGKIKLKGKNAAGLVYVILLLFPVVISLGGAILTTVLVMKSSDAKYELDDITHKELAR